MEWDSDDANRDHKSFSLWVTRSQCELEFDRLLRSLSSTGSLADCEQDENQAPRLSHDQSASSFHTGNIVLTRYRQNKTGYGLISSWQQCIVSQAPTQGSAALLA